jgi:hypothetical protein
LRGSDMNALVFWMVYFGAARNDRIHIEVTGPDGQVVVENDIVQEKDRAQQFYSVGRKVTDGAIVSGVYTGTATVVREGAEVVSRRIVKTVAVE